MPDIDDLLVRVQHNGPPGSDHYTVEAWLAGGRRINERDELNLADYRTLEDSSPAAIAAHGLDLFNRLFSGRLALAFQQAWSAAGARGRLLRLRLDLDPDAPALHAIPWELMFFDDSGGVNPPRPIAVDARICFSRYIESAVFDEGRPIADRPIRMLCAIAAPADLPRWGLAVLNRATEERDLRTRFSAVVASGQFRCDFLPQVTPQTLRDALNQGRLPDADGADEHQARGYDVLLFYGHALHDDQLGSRLLLEDGSGNGRLFPGEELLAMLKQLPAAFRPSLVALVACNSAAGGRINSLAARLVTVAGVPAVLAMQRLVEIALARGFTFHLSDHLLRDGVIDVAVNAARRLVYQADGVGWTTPVLYMRNAEGRLFSPNAQLEYVQTILRQQSFARWSGAEFIDIGALPVAPGQDWRLLRVRPEDAPAVASALESLDRALRLGLRHYLGRGRAEDQSIATNLVAVLGPPHSGQTTLLQRLAFELAEAVVENVTRPLGVYITLAGFEQQRGASRLERHIVEQARLATGYLGDALVELFRPARADGQRPGFVFLLDGLDAVPEKFRRELGRELHELALRHPDQRFVLAAAQEQYPGQALPRALVLLLQPLSEQQILRYCRQRDEPRAVQIYRQIRENRLLALARDPSLLALLYERLAADPDARLTRNQLIQEYLDRALADLEPPFAVGDAARETLAELAWASRWAHREVLSLPELFALAQQVRRQRDYSLEELYDLLRSVRLLIGVGLSGARFVNPMLHAYLAATALMLRPDRVERVADIVTLCASPERLRWWEEVIYALAGLESDPTPLFERLAAATRSGSANHALIAARCLDALPPEQEARLAPELRAELVDACVLRLRSEREPSPEQREQLVAALGRLSYQPVANELRRILVEKVRPTVSGPRYEYTNVRIAAARALRNIFLSTTPAPPAMPAPVSAEPLVLSDYLDIATMAEQARFEQTRMRSMQEIANERMLLRLMRIWRKGPAGRDEFRELLQRSPSPPERALAAFALGDLPDSENRRLLDAKLLLRVIVSPGDQDDSRLSEDWEDTMWAAADALTLFESELVVPLLRVLVARSHPIPDSAAQQLAYLAGRLRAADPLVVDWLIGLLICNASQSVKAKALQSLAWMGSDIPQRQLTMADGRLGSTLKEIIQDIAAARQIASLELGAYVVRLRPGDDGSPAYLRRKAVEALAWVGDHDTLRDLGAASPSWPLELRESWYQAAATIRERIKDSAAR